MRLSPAFTLALGTGYARYFAPGTALFDGVEAGLRARISIAGLSSGAVSVEHLKLEPIFPVFYSHYDSNKFGEVEIRNGEDGAIRDVKVSYFIKQYMSEPKLCAEFESIKKNGSVSAPIYALLSENVLKLTENTKVSSEVIVDYSFLGAKRQVRWSGPVEIRHRNAMSWDDDRRAAAFVSAKDPAVLRYSKYAAGLIREADKLPEIDQNLKFAIGLFEGLRLYGLNYVIDPTTPYKELSESASAVDFLQYPYQTLVYKGGDCDDLSIMFAAVFQSVGIDVAFITVPGHIYIAFALSSDESTAKRTFAFPDDLIFEGGKAWLPVEITLVNKGFAEAWQYGAREWGENPDARAILPIPDAWAVYEPVGIPGEDTRIALPSAEGIVAAYKKSISVFVDKELKSQVDKIKKELASAPGDGRLLNKLGILYARYGKYPEAKSEFDKSAKAGYQNAIANLGNLALLSKDWTSAVAQFGKALDANPTSSVALLGMARAKHELGDIASAALFMAKLQENSPQLAKAYAYVGSDRAAARASAAMDEDEVDAWDE